MLRVLLSLSSSKLHRFGCGQRIQHLAQNPHAVEFFARHQQLFLARTALVDVDGREHTLVHQLAVEVDFHVAGAFELFEDHVVHAAAGIDQRGRDDGQRTAFFDVAGRAEEALRTLQRVRIDTARQDFARRRNDGVVGARQTRDRIEQDDDVVLVLDQALGLFDHHLGHLHVTRGRFVEGRADHFALHRALHVGDFFRPLVDQQNDQSDFRMIGRDGVGDGLQQHRLTGTRRSNDQAALALCRSASADPSRGRSSCPGPSRASAARPDTAASGCRRRSCCAIPPAARS